MAPETDDSDLESLSNKSSKLAADLDRNWLVQIITAGVALLYLTDQSKAGKLAENVNVDPGLIEIAIPLVFSYLFIRMGYLLGIYLETQSLLIGHLPDGRKRGELFLLIHHDVTVFALLARIVNPTGLRSSTKSGLAKPLYWLGRIPYALLIAFVGAVYAVNAGLGLYFVFDWLQERVPDLKVVVPTIAGILLTWFYVQFVFSNSLRFKRQLSRLAVAIAALIFVTAATLAVWMITTDPIEPDKVTKPPSTCDQGHERLDAWETALNVPDDLSSMEPNQARQVLRAIENAYPEGYAQWQFELQILGSACYGP